MTVTISFSGRKNDPGDKYQERCEVKVDGKVVAFGANFSECPEDANLGRDLRFVYGLPEVLRAAHASGRRGESFVFKEIVSGVEEETRE